MLLKYTRTDDVNWMAWSNLANLFCGSSHDFCQLYYNIKQIDFIFLCFCTVIIRWRHSVWRTKSQALDCVSCVHFCSSHAMTSSVIYYSTDARKNEIYLLNYAQEKTLLTWKLLKRFRVTQIYTNFCKLSGTIFSAFTTFRDPTLQFCWLTGCRVYNLIVTTVYLMNIIFSLQQVRWCDVAWRDVM